MIRRSQTRDNPMDRAALDVSGALGARAAETILATVLGDRITGRTYDRTRLGTHRQKALAPRGPSTYAVRKSMNSSSDTESFGRHLRDRICCRIDIAAGALGNTDVMVTHKIRVIDAHLVLRGAGVSSTTLQVKNGATAITNAMAAS